MQLNLWIILGTCVAVIVLGYGIYWIIIKINNILSANRSRSLNGERQTPSTFTEDIDGSSLKKPLNQANLTPEIRSKTDTEPEEGGWLNKGVPEVSAKTIHKDDDDWLNTGIAEVPTRDNKKQDDDWLNAENNQLLETSDQFSLTRATTNPPEIQIKQDGSIFHITVTASHKQNTKPEQTVINLKINLSPQASSRRGEWPYGLKITPEGSPPSYLSLQDIITIKPVEEPINQSHALLDEISIRPVESQVLESHALLDEVSVRPVESKLTTSYIFLDELPRRSGESQITESHVLLDEISIKPSPGPVKIEYALFEDLITKSILYRTKKAEPASAAVISPVESPVVIAESASGAIINPVESPAEEAEPASSAVINPVESPVEKAEPANGAIINPVESPVVNAEPASGAIISPVESPVVKAEPASSAVISPLESPAEKAEPVKTISMHEITKMLREESDLKQTKISLSSAESRYKKSLARMGEGRGNLRSQSKDLKKKAEFPGAVKQALATLRIFNNNEFYIQDTNLTHIDKLMPEPQIKDLTFKVLNSVTELDELIAGGYDLVMDLSKIKRGLKKGMVAFLLLVGRELASMGWACMTEESKETFRGYPYNDDLDNKACVVGDWTNPKFLDSSLFSSYVRHQRQLLLKEKGFTSERSIVEESRVKDFQSMIVQDRFKFTHKRRTYFNVAFPGILGVEVWKEHSLNETDTQPPYQMATLSILVLPSPPNVADLRVNPKIMKLNRIKTQHSRIGIKTIKK